MKGRCDDDYIFNVVVLYDNFYVRYLYSDMTYRAISWGCGVQSTAMVVMSVLGDLEPVDMIITADPGWERKATYEARGFYMGWLQEHGVKVEIIYSSNIREQGNKNSISMPFWTASGGPLRRQCTGSFKIRPIKRRLRELIGYDDRKAPHPPRDSIEMWLGISLDEFTRMNQSTVKFIKNRYPLIEKRISRNECIEYLEDHSLPVPVKSACIGCPYRSASEWLEMKISSPQEFDDAVDFDNASRTLKRLQRGDDTDDRTYIYSRAKPLCTANLEADAKRERKGKQLPLMICESGYCMV